jgi:hypothetical protein
MPYKFFHPSEQYENYKKNKRFLEIHSGWRCPPQLSDRHPKAAPHIRWEGTCEQNNLWQRTIKNPYRKQIYDTTFAAQKNR